MTTDHKSSKAGSKSPLITILKYLLILVVVYFAGKKLVDNWQEVTSYRWSLNPLLLIVSIAAHIVTFAMLSYVWCYIISGFGYRVRFSHAFKISYIANLGRYIPGKIWPVFGMVYFARRIAINEEAAVASWALAQVYAIPASFLACLMTMLIQPEMFTKYVGSFVDAGIYIAAGVIFIVSVLVVVIPNQALYLFNILLRKLKRPEVSFRLDKKTALKIYLGYFISWLAFGFSFWLFLHAVIDNPSIPVASAVAAFVLAYQIGYLTLFSPGGLGVRELVLTSVLSPYVGPVAAGVAVASRLWNMVSEIIAAAIALRIKLPERTD